MISFKPILIIVLVIAITNGQLPHENYGLPSEFRREFKAERTTKAPSKLPVVVGPKLPEPPRIPDTEYGLPKDNLVPFIKSNEIKIVEDEKYFPLSEVPRTTVETKTKVEVTKEIKVTEKPKVMLPAGLPSLPLKPKISEPQKEYGLPKEMKEVFKKPEKPKVMLPPGLPKLPEKPILPKVVRTTTTTTTTEASLPVPQKEYGLPKEMKVVFKEPERPKIMLPMGLPALPPKPKIPKKPVVKAPYPAPHNEYGLPKEMKVVFKEAEKPKVTLPSGLPDLPKKPIIKEVKKIEKAVPHSTYEVPKAMKILFKEPEKPKIMLPSGLPKLPAKPVIPKVPKIKIEIEVKKEEPSALPLKPTIVAPELPKLPVKPKPEVIDAPYPAKVDAPYPAKIDTGVISREMKVYIPKTSPEIVVESRPIFSAPYPPALPHSEYGLPL